MRLLVALLTTKRQGIDLKLALNVVNWRCVNIDIGGDDDPEYRVYKEYIFRWSSPYDWGR
jgi:hypothetical protein